jgi:hypothetical protein
MKKDTVTGIAVLGIGAVALYALTRKQKSDDLGVFPDAWNGGSATPATPPTPGITPIINFPEVPPYVEQQPPEWLFSPQIPYTDYAGGGSTHKKETVPPSSSTATYTTEDPIHPAVGPTSGFGGGGAGGRGGAENNLLGDMLKTLFSPLTLLASATPFGAVTLAPRAGLALASAVTKKDDKMVQDKTAFDVATDSTTSVAGGGGGVGGRGGGGGSGGSGTVSSKKSVSAPSEDIADFFTAGKNYGSATVVGHSSAGTVYQHSGGARSVVSGGQIVAGSSRALSSSDIARLPKKTRQALGY